MDETDYTELAKQYKHPRTARSMLMSAHPKTGDINTAVQIAVGHPITSIEETIQEFLEKGVTERTEDSTIIRLKSTGGK